MAIIKQILYCSIPTMVISRLDLERLMEHAKSHNSSRGLSGVLLQGSGKFIQLLEGPPAEVDRLVAKIRKDDRHDYFSTIVEHEADRPFYSDWAMECVVFGAEIKKIDEFLLMCLNTLSQDIPFNRKNDHMLSLFTGLVQLAKPHTRY